MVAEPLVVDPTTAETTTFRLLCDDFLESQRPAFVEEFSRIASKVKNVLKTTKMKHMCDYKNVAYWKSLGICHPLAHIEKIIGRTSSTSPQYKWIPPSHTYIASSTISGTTMNSRNTVDLFVKIPHELFGKRDFVNVVYPVKRAHYMCSCALALVSAFPGADLSFTVNTAVYEDFLFPNLLLSERNKHGGVVIHFYGDEDALAKVSRFAPSASNLRPQSVKPEYKGDNEAPTPTYNQRLLLIMSEEALNRKISESLSKNENIVKALSLIDAWFSVRKFKQFNHLFHSVFLMAQLKKDSALEKQDVLSVIKSYFAAFVSWIPSDGIGLCEDVESDLLASHVAAFPAVLLDDTGFLNLAFGLTSDEVTKVKTEMSTTIPLLGDSARFDSQFLDTQHFYDMFDEYIRLTVSPKEFAVIAQKFSVDVIDLFDVKKVFLKNLADMIHTGLVDRFEYFGVHNLVETKKQWFVNSSLPTNHAMSLLIGFKITKQWTNPISVGPVANEPSAKVFRSFWHGATTLRKFADTRVCECMVWGENPCASVPSKIFLFLLNKNYGLNAESISWRSKFYSNADERQVQDNINSAFSSLSTILRSLKNIPLLVTNIHGVSPFLRGTEPHVSQAIAVEFGGVVDNICMPSTHRIPKFTPSVQVFIKMEYSGKWGEDIAAIRKITAAFYIQIAEQLRSAHSLLAVPTEECIYVVKDKIVFKLIIVNDKVHKLLEKQVDELRNTGASRIESTPEGKALSNFRKSYVSEMQVQQSLHSFSLKSSFFAPAVQLMKSWLAAHQLSGNLHDLVIEMIVAASIDYPGLPTPCSTISAFRRCLKLIAQHNWLTRPLVVDFDNAWNEEAISKIEANFVKMRPVLPPMVIVTNEDPVGTKWTRDGPSPLILKRIIALANNALRIIDEAFSKTAAVDLFGSLLQTDFSLYDAVIDLHPKVITRSLEPSGESELKHLPVIDFDPIADFVKTAENFFGTSVIFFYNKYGGSKIGIKFKPGEEEVPSKISRCSLHFSVDRDRLKLNREEILENLELIGKGLVKKIIRNV